jgi:nitrite reductase/ring-hydroxylating ferredoxin subunit
MNWIKLFPLTILSSEDFLEKVTISGKKLCVVKTDGKLFAIQNKCPHAGAQLSNGWCSKGKIICPYHIMTEYFFTCCGIFRWLMKMLYNA